MKTNISLIFAILAFMRQTSLFANVSVPNIFGSNMVLQQDMALPVWGQADPGEKITVIIDTQNVETTTGDDGTWGIKLTPIHGGGPYTMTINGKNRLVFTGVLVGEVWLCSGQSNMELPICKANNHDQEISQANHPEIRLFKVGHNVADAPQKTNKGYWAVCSSQTASNFSAVAYYFGRDLQKKLNVPVGLLDVSWSGTLIEAWMSHAALSSDPDFKPIFDKFAQQLAEYPDAKAKYDHDLPELTKKYNEAVAAALAEGAGLPSHPHPPVGPGSQATPSGIFNGEICPVASFAIRGVVWYQGEQNVDRGNQYYKLLPALIKDWRTLWQEGDFPFLIIQLPNLGLPPKAPGSSNWAELRDAQSQATILSNTAVVVTIDLGEAKNLHPTNKQDVGYRAALYAEWLAYAQPVVPTGPVFEAMHMEGQNIRLEFSYAEGLKTKDGGPVKGFAVASDDQKFIWVPGKIDGKTVLLQTGGVHDPVVIRYDWAQNPIGNLYNGANLPARPFRTDNFPLTSVGRNSM